MKISIREMREKIYINISFNRGDYDSFFELLSIIEDLMNSALEKNSALWKINSIRYGKNNIYINIIVEKADKEKLSSHIHTYIENEKYKKVKEYLKKI